jgi:hypothetical protein
MAKSSKHATIWKSTEPTTPKRLDFGFLGEAISYLPPLYWESGMLFRGASDRCLRALTGTFPATFRADRLSHPIFVLQTLTGLGHRVCPCSSKNYGASRLIHKGCRLAHTNRLTERDSYLVEDCSFNVPLDPAFCHHLRFLGLVPSLCLQACHR